MFLQQPDQVAAVEVLAVDEVETHHVAVGAGVVEFLVAAVVDEAAEGD